MKTIRIFIAILCLGLLLSACSDAPAVTESAATTGTTAAPLPKIGLCIRNRVELPDYYAQLEQALVADGYDVLLRDGENDQSLQDAQVQALIQEGCQLIISEPVMVSAQENVINAAKNAGIPLIMLNHPPEQAVLHSYDKLCYVGFDPAQPGILQGQAVALLPDGGDLNGDGSVSYVVITGPEDHLDAQMHTEGSVPAAQSQALEICHTDWALESGLAACKRILSKYGPDIEVVLCANAALALGAAQAVEEYGWLLGQDLYLLGMGNEPQLLSMVAQGTVASSVIRDYNGQFSLLINTIHSLQNGTQPEKVCYAAHVTATVENAANYIH